MEKVAMKLVQATVTFTVNVDALMPADIGEKELEERMTDLAAKQWEYAANDECDIDNEVDVEISIELANAHNGKVISDETWKRIMAEHRKGMEGEGA